MLTVNQLVGFGATSGGTLRDVLAGLGLTTNLRQCLDAGAIASYPGSGQKWLDLSGNGYDMMLGSETASGSTGDEPAFVGTAGGLSSGEYFLQTNGDEFFQYDTTVETWMSAYHQNNALFSILLWYFHKSASGNDVLFNTASSGIADGVYIDVDNNTTTFSVRDAGAASEILVEGSTTIGADAWHLLGVSVDEATGAGGGFLYLDGAFDQVSASNTFNATYASPSANAANTFRIGARPAGATAPMPAGTRYGGAMFWGGRALSKAEMDSVWAATRARYGV